MTSTKFLVKQNSLTWFSLISFFFIITLSVTPITAQSSVIGIRFNGQTVNSANTTVMPPGQGSTKAQINKGDKLASGTRLIIPPGTVIVLQSPGGKQVCSSTQGKAMEYTVKITAQGENHTVRGQGAQISSTVAKSVGYNYRVNNGRGTTSAAKGTEFIFTDMSTNNTERAVISTQEGSINIIDEVPVTIGGQVSKNKRGEPLTKAIAQVQSSGSGDYYSSDSPVDYNDYNQAINDVSSEINAIEDPEERADNLLCLGDLYIDTDQAQSAIEPYYQAYVIYNEYYGPDDLDTLEAQLCVADALELSDQVDKANQYIEHARNVLAYMLQMNVDDINYLSQLDYYDEEDIYAICDELSDIYALLGWSYEIQGDDVQSQEYYDASEAVCND